MAKYLKLNTAQKLRGHVNTLTLITRQNGVQIPPAIEAIAIQELEMFEMMATIAIRIEEMMNAGTLEIKIYDNVEAKNADIVSEDKVITEFADLVGLFQTDEVASQPSPLILPDKKKLVRI